MTKRLLTEGEKNVRNKEKFFTKKVTKEIKVAKVESAFGHSLFENQIAEKWLSTKEAASYLGLTPNALRILVHRGRVRAYKLGARLKFRVRDLKASLQLKEVL